MRQVWYICRFLLNSDSCWCLVDSQTRGRRLALACPRSQTLRQGKVGHGIASTFRSSVRRITCAAQRTRRSVPTLSLPVRHAVLMYTERRWLDQTTVSLCGWSLSWNSWTHLALIFILKIRSWRRREGTGLKLRVGWVSWCSFLGKLKKNMLILWLLWKVFRFDFCEVEAMCCLFAGLSDRPKILTLHQGTLERCSAHSSTHKQMDICRSIRMLIYSPHMHIHEFTWVHLISALNQQRNMIPSAFHWKSKNVLFTCRTSWFPCFLGC